ncbi:response regulator receiver [Strigomonas culicis]|uniref:Response regulator receiver n=1 Tax=Strigomonas culicis TaxID=28005 RepID=S9UK45_9TRYP|nr:response regulator receiver [Strigomonas culicis]|eukprot:EPY15046.1 response regulator receiver [Strigomonas culicis]
MLTSALAAVERREAERAQQAAQRRRAAQERSHAEPPAASTPPKAPEKAPKRRETIGKARGRIVDVSAIQPKQTDASSASKHPHSKEMPSSITEGSAQDTLPDSTMDALRRRNMELEAELHRWRRQAQLPSLRAPPLGGDACGGAPAVPSAAAAVAAAPPSQVVTGTAAACSSCRAVQRQAHELVSQLMRAQAEKDTLLNEVHDLKSKLLWREAEAPLAATSAAPRPEASEEHQAQGCFVSVFDIVGSLSAGCTALEARLVAAATCLDRLHAEAGQVSRPGQPPGAGLTHRLLKEHIEAVRAVAEALRCIGARRFDGLRGDVLSRTATAADVVPYTALLSYECERVMHLRAFLPTFAQLAVATEHIEKQLRLQ